MKGKAKDWYVLEVLHQNGKSTTERYHTRDYVEFVAEDARKAGCEVRLFKSGRQVAI